MAQVLNAMQLLEGEGGVSKELYPLGTKGRLQDRNRGLRESSRLLSAPEPSSLW